MSLVGETVRQGDRVRVTRSVSSTVINGYINRTVRPEWELRITRVGHEQLWVRSDDRGESFSIYRGDLEFFQDDPNAPARRPLGQKPDDTPEMTYISQDDPRIQWLWDDLGQFAKGKRWCGDYDDLALKMGIPGRKQNFNTRMDVGGLVIAATIEARTQDEADTIFAARIAALQTPGAQGTGEPKGN